VSLITEQDANEEKTFYQDDFWELVAIGTIWLDEDDPRWEELEVVPEVVESRKS